MCNFCIFYRNHESLTKWCCAFWRKFALKMEVICQKENKCRKLWLCVYIQLYYVIVNQSISLLQTIFYIILKLGLIKKIPFWFTKNAYILVIFFLIVENLKKTNIQSYISDGISKIDVAANRLKYFPKEALQLLVKQLHISDPTFLRFIFGRLTYHMWRVVYCVQKRRTFTNWMVVSLWMFVINRKLTV